MTLKVVTPLSMALGISARYSKSSKIQACSEKSTTLPASPSSRMRPSVVSMVSFSSPVAKTTMVVTPPCAALRATSARESMWFEYARQWTWGSMTPGRTSLPETSSASSAAGMLSGAPIQATLPSRTPMAASWRP